MANSQFFSFRELRKEEFEQFMKLIQQREPEFRDKLAAANKLVSGMVMNSDPHMEATQSHSSLFQASSTASLDPLGESDPAPTRGPNDFCKTAVAEIIAPVPCSLSQIEAL